MARRGRKIDRDELIREPSGVLVSRRGRDKGTENTRRYLVSDHLLKLYHADKLTQEQYDAALEIGEAVHLITTPVRVRVSDPSREVFARRGDDYESLRAVRITSRYLDWVDAMAARARACKRPQDRRRWMVGPVLDICADGMTCWQVERKWGIKTGGMMARLTDALDLYVVSPKRERPQGLAA